jgi:hypothetical protein
MSLKTIICVNTATGCNTEVEKQITVTGPSCYIVRIPASSNAIGPFDIYIDSTSEVPYATNISRNDMINGYVVCFDLTPTPTPTPTLTQTPTNTPSNTPTQSATPQSTPTSTPTPTNSSTPTVTPTNTATQTPTVTPTATLGSTPTQTPSNTATPTVTPTNTSTPTVTPTNTSTPTPTLTQTPTQTPSPTSNPYYAYVFAEPFDSTDDTTLLNYALANGAVDWYSWQSAGSPPSNAGGNYSNDLDVYAHQPSFIGGLGNFELPTTLKQIISHYNGQIINGVSQNIYTFGTVQVSNVNVTPSLQYFYSIWIPLAGVGGSISNMTIDVGTTLGGSEIFNNVNTVTSLTSLNVNVTSGAAIPAGTYRVLWVSPNFLLPPITPLIGSLYFRGDTKT